MRANLDSDTTRVPSVPDPGLAQRLQSLPDTLPPYDYGEFSRRLARRRAVQHQSPLRLLAAALAVVVVGWGVRHGLGPVTSELAMLDGPPPPAVEQPAAAVVVAAAAAPAAASAERWLNAQPRSAIVRMPTQMAVTELEDQIASIDDQLTAVGLSQPHAQQQLAVLRRDRAQLVESLAQVRYAQILVAGLQ